MSPGSIVNVAFRASPANMNGSVPVSGVVPTNNNTAFGVIPTGSLLNSTLPNDMTKQRLVTSPFLPIRACNESYGDVSARQINDYIRSADESGIPIMSMATCEQIASYIANYPRPISGPEYCHQIGQRPAMPAVKKSEMNKDGFVYIMFPKVPVEVVELTESTIIRGELYSDGSITSTGMSVASAISNVNGPLFASVAAENMVMTPIDDYLSDDLSNGASNQDSPLTTLEEIVYEFPVGQSDDDAFLTPFLDGFYDTDSDVEGPSSSLTKNRFTTSTESDNGKVVPGSYLDNVVPSNDAVRRSPALSRYASRN